jgi:MOSC domain-containing protein
VIRDRVTALNLYPLKSAHAATVNGEFPTALPVGVTGFEVNGVRDRDWVLFDPANNCFVSQRGWDADQKQRHRGDRRLATVHLDIQSDHVAVASAAGHLELPNEPIEGAHRELDIFGKKLPVVEQAKGASDYFSRLLEREVMLVRSDHERSRALPAHYQREGAFNQVAGADGFPFLLTSEASLAAAHARSGKPQGSVPIDRYRGNVVIAGDELGPFREDYIDTASPFRIGEVGAWVVKACSRCPIPNNDQESGELVGGGIGILQGRRGKIFTGEEGKFFGQNLAHANEGIIGVGDSVVIQSLSSTPNIEFFDAV